MFVFSNLILVLIKNLLEINFKIGLITINIIYYKLLDCHQNIGTAVVKIYIFNLKNNF